MGIIFENDYFSKKSDSLLDDIEQIQKKKENREK
jgi:hypothetical protein